MKGTEKKETKSKKKIAVIASLIAAVLFIVVIVLVVFLNKNSKDSSGLYSKYNMTVDSGDNNKTVFSMEFNKSDKTFEEKLDASDKSVTLSKGSYEEKDGTVTTTSDSDQTTQKFAIQGKYLVATDFLYDGEIPDGNTFEVKCTYTNENDAEYSITFREDGTYTLDSNGDTTEGTYKRDGDIITRTDDASEGNIDYLIYNNQITNSYYVAD
jgi:hypothetical protein